MALVLRHPGPGQFSVERVFRDVLAALPADIDARLVTVPFFSKGVIPRLRNVLFTARLEADVVHITGDIQYCALGVRARRCLLTVLDLGSVWRLTGWRRRLLTLLWYRLPARRAAAVTTISEAVRDELVRLLPSADRKTSVVGCPVGGEFSPGPPSRSRSSWFCVLQVGTTPNKNLERVARALEGLPIHFHVVGQLRGDQRELLDRLDLSYSQAADLPRDELRDLYRSSSALVFASTYEGFGLPILEAQACGLPVITSAIRPLCDVAKGAALLVDPSDTVAIRRAVERLISNPALRRSLSEAGYINAARHSAKEIALEYAGVYRRLAGIS